MAGYRHSPEAPVPPTSPTISGSSTAPIDPTPTRLRQPRFLPSAPTQPLTGYLATVRPPADSREGSPASSDCREGPIGRAADRLACILVERPQGLLSLDPALQLGSGLRLDGREQLLRLGHHPRGDRQRAISLSQLARPETTGTGRRGGRRSARPGARPRTRAARQTPRRTSIGSVNATARSRQGARSPGMGCTRRY